MSRKAELKVRKAVSSSPLKKSVLTCPPDGNVQGEEGGRSFGSRLLERERKGSCILLPIAVSEGVFSVGNFVEQVVGDGEG